MNILKMVDSAISVRKIGRAETFITGATFIASGINSAKEDPKTSVIKSLLGGYLLYKALSKDGHTAMF